jgi:Holliday junction resolvasome RuvABC DNA-binding subunit
MHYTFFKTSEQAEIDLLITQVIKRDQLSVTYMCKFDTHEEAEALLRMLSIPKFGLKRSVSTIRRIGGLQELKRCVSSDHQRLEKVFGKKMAEVLVYHLKNLTDPLGEALTSLGIPVQYAVPGNDLEKAIQDSVAAYRKALT